MGEDATLARLRWQCRRGMAELDALLLNFVDRHYPELDAGRLRDLERLLKTPDPMLLEYLMGRMVPADPALAALARQIREAV